MLKEEGTSTSWSGIIKFNRQRPNGLSAQDKILEFASLSGEIK